MKEKHANSSSGRLPHEDGRYILPPLVQYVVIIGIVVIIVVIERSRK